MAAANNSVRFGSLSNFKITLGGAMKAAAVVALIAAAGAAHAQAKPSASRTAEISAYGGFSFAKPDFGPESDHNTGGAIGFNYTRFFYSFPVHPSLELRGTYNTGTSITEKSFSGGFRGTYDFVDKYDFRDRLHPYVFVLGGAGTLKYDHFLGIPSDRGFILSGGAGINVDAYKHFQVMVDAELQNWNLGKNAYLKPDGDNYTLAPKILTVGISYRVPAHSRSKVADTK